MNIFPFVKIINIMLHVCVRVCDFLHFLTISWQYFDLMETEPYLL